MSRAHNIRTFVWARGLRMFCIWYKRIKSFNRIFTPPLFWVEFSMRPARTWMGQTKLKLLCFFLRLPATPYTHSTNPTTVRLLEKYVLVYTRNSKLTYGTSRRRRVAQYEISVKSWPQKKKIATFFAQNVFLHIQLHEWGFYF